MSDNDLIRREDALAACAPHFQATIAALPPAKQDDLASGKAVTLGVRPLVWKGDSIRVTANGMGKYYSCMRMFHGQKGAGWECDEGDWHPSLDAAKAAAQADYEARILAALEPVDAAQPSPQEVVDALKDAAAVAMKAREAALREAAAVCEYVIKNIDILKADGETYETPRVQKIARGLVNVARQDILALIPKGAADDRA